MNTMLYRGYASQTEYSNDDGCFVGHIAGIDDVVGFHGESVAELRAAFEEAVDDYLQICEKLNRPPQKPCCLLVLLISFILQNRPYVLSMGFYKSETCLQLSQL